MTSSPSDDQREQLRAAFEAADLKLEELWLRYFALGGEAGLTEIDAYINRLMPLSALEHDKLAHVINEYLAETTPPRAAYTGHEAGDHRHGHADDQGKTPVTVSTTAKSVLAATRTSDAGYLVDRRRLDWARARMRFRDHHRGGYFCSRVPAEGANHGSRLADHRPLFRSRRDLGLLSLRTSHQ